MKKLMLSALVGMLISMSWLTFSWSVLPWPKVAFKSFKNEKFVGWILKENAHKRGVYVLPYPFGKKSKNMPHFGSTFAFVAFDPSGGYSYTKSFIVSIINHFAISFVLSWLLLYSKQSMQYMGRVWFITIIGLTAIVMINVGNWNWWGFAWQNVLLVSVNSLIGIFLAALSIASMIRPSEGDN